MILTGCLTRHFFVFLFLLLSQGCIAQTKEEKLEQIIRETRQNIISNMDKYDVPGASVALFNQHETLWMESFGVQDRKTNAPVTPETIFSIMSISKTVTATAIMKAVQEGKLDLDKPITDYLPDFSLNSPFEQYPERKITLRRLLNHTSGLDSEASGGNNYISGNKTFEEYAKTIQDTWLLTPVGYKHIYTNTAIDLAAYLLAEVAGKSYAQVVQESLFLPLGMEGSFIDTHHKNGSCDQCAVGHDKNFIALPSYVPISGSGGARMSIKDAVKFAQFHLNMGRLKGLQIIKPEYLNQMYTRSSKVTGWGEGVWYGLGIYTWPENDVLTFNHYGGGFGYRAVIKWYPEYGIGVVMLMNGYDADTTADHWDATKPLLRKLVSHNLVSKPLSSGVTPAKTFYENMPSISVSDDTYAPLLVPTRHQDVWREYEGQYRFIYAQGFKAKADFEALPERQIYIYAKDGYLHFKRGSFDERLHQKEPGLFFLETDISVLDLRGPVPTLSNIALRKID